MTTDLTDLSDALTDVALADERLLKAKERRDKAIRELQGVVGATELARQSGLTRNRIYQIWEG